MSHVILGEPRMLINTITMLRGGGNPPVSTCPFAGRQTPALRHGVDVNYLVSCFQTSMSPGVNSSVQRTTVNMEWYRGKEALKTRKFTVLTLLEMSEN